MEVSNHKLKELLADQGATFDSVHDGFEAWLYDFTVIRISSMGVIDFDHFESIAIDQLEMSSWGFDYWCGENGIF